MKVLLVLTCVVSLSLCASGYFDYKKGGADWTSGQCSMFNHYEQSPIDITQKYLQYSDYKGYVYVPKGDVEMEYQVDNTMTIKLSYPKAIQNSSKVIKSRMSNADGNWVDFSALQFHFHAPSEHLVEGQQAAAEMHIVTARSDGQNDEKQVGRWLSVLGFMFVEDNTAPDLPLLTAINKQVGKGGAAKTVKVKINMEEFFQEIPVENQFWHYLGGLTTPGCDELVYWYLSKHPLRVNKAQLKPMRDLWVKQSFNGLVKQGNNRVVQQIAQRKVFSGHYTLNDFVNPPKSQRKDTNEHYLVTLLVFLILLVVLTLMYFCRVCERKQEKDKSSK